MERLLVTDNDRVADRLREAAALLRAQGTARYRASAYRRAADAIERLPRDVKSVFEREGVRGLDAIPGVGLGVAAAIAQMLATGRWAELDRLRAATDPRELLRTVPGIGPGLARRIHDELHIDTLEALEAAARDGRLDRVRGLGTRRTAGVRASLGGRLHGIAPLQAPRDAH